MSARRPDPSAPVGTPPTSPAKVTATAASALHVGLWVAWLLSLASVIAQGLGRFAYSLLLPPMREDLSWTYAVAGSMNTSNSLGYLLGALVAAWLGRGQRCKPVMVVSLLVAVAAIGGCALTSSVPVLLVLRFVTGAAGAIGFVLAAGLLATLSKKAPPERASVMLGIYFAGGCVGIVFVGLLLPLAVPDPSQWRTAWVVLGVAGLACVAAMFPALRVATPEPARPAGDRRFPRAAITALLVSYLLFGAGYIAYMTFVVALLRADGASATTVSVFWSLLGLCGVGAAFFWGPLIGRLPHARGMAFLMVLCAVGALVPVALRGTPAAMVSAVLFGGTFVSVITAVTVSARASLPSRYWTAAIGTLTVTFSVGQSIGPVLTGLLADTDGGLRLGLGLSAVLLAIGAGVAALHRNPEQRHDQGDG
ncbi:MAG: YbfB/YjiJ family MFS transporter [Austwickia sp.]|nr:YbfB/YjiJ family MFS transporter [Austwickia sp.]MBK8437240.1 YbfB/YjiJ family MFS transporter [Austwickia sp.]MBK9102473.1 YbfB/YjiJ family MFS transporter [Austwickia sp.]